mgnify:FL=1
MNRKLTSPLADLHFPPTEDGQQNLLAENIPYGRIEVTGNAVIDAMFQAIGTIDDSPELQARLQSRFDFIDPDKRIVLATGHRRESFDGGLERVRRVLGEIAARRDFVALYPVHHNLYVQGSVNKILHECDNVHLIPPLDNLDFLYLMRRAHIIVIDAGGIQEEVPSLGKPVLVARDTTERAEAVKTGTVDLVGTDIEKLRHRLNALLDDDAICQKLARAHNPYGNGRASKRNEKRLRHEYI